MFAGESLRFVINRMMIETNMSTPALSSLIYESIISIFLIILTNLSTRSSYVIMSIMWEY